VLVILRALSEEEVEMPLLRVCSPLSQPRAPLSLLHSRLRTTLSLLHHRHPSPHHLYAPISEGLANQCRRMASIDVLPPTSTDAKMRPSSTLQPYMHLIG
jgi:hypothetical protein